MNALQLPFLFALSAGLPASGVGTNEPPPPEESRWLEWETMTGDWGGLRSKLGERGVTVDMVLIQDLFTVPTGGVDNGTSHARYLEIGVGFDMQSLFGVEGATAFIDGYHTAGQGPGSKTGALQGNSNIESDPVVILAELWWDQQFVGARTRVKVGKFDANSEFAYTENGGEFVNPSMGFSPTVFTLPTFPLPAWAGLVEFSPTADTFLRVGLFDGAGSTGLDTGHGGPSFWRDHPTSAFWIAELGGSWGSTHPGHLGLGGWLHNGSFDRFDGGTENDISGTYAVFDQHLVKLAEGRDLACFAQLGLADEDVSEIGLHFGAGAVLTDEATGRALGLGVSSVEFSDEPGAGFSEEREVIAETFVRFQPIDWLSIKADIQYVKNPGGDSTIGDALAMGVRLEWSL